MKSLLHANTLLVNKLSTTNQTKFKVMCLPRSLVQSQCKLHALKVEPLLAVFTLNHVSVITFRESTYAVNMNECMLTFSLHL